MGNLSLRQDYQGVLSRIVRRGGHISEKELGASFPASFDVLSSPMVPKLTVHRHKRSSGDPLFTLVAALPIDMPVNNEGPVDIDDIKYRASGIAIMVQDGRARPIRKRTQGALGPIVAYAIRPTI